VGSRRGLLCSVCVCVCVCVMRERDCSGVWYFGLVGLGFPASAVVYVAGPGAPGHLPVCVAYGHLSLSPRIIISPVFVQVPECLSGSHAFVNTTTR